VSTVHTLLPEKNAADKHSNSRNANEIEHHAAHQTVLNNALTTTVDAVFGRKQLRVLVEFVEDVDVHCYFDQRVADSVGHKAVERLAVFAQTVQRDVHKVTKGHDGHKPQHKVNGAIGFVVKPGMRGVGHIAPYDQRNHQRAEVQHDNIQSKNGVHQVLVAAKFQMQAVCFVANTFGNGHTEVPQTPQQECVHCRHGEKYGQEPAGSGCGGMNKAAQGGGKEAPNIMRPHVDGEMKLRVPLPAQKQGCLHGRRLERGGLGGGGRCSERGLGRRKRAGQEHPSRHCKTKSRKFAAAHEKHERADEEISAEEKILVFVRRARSRQA
jgi:hypothetical protein